MGTWKERGKYFWKEMKDPYYKGVPGEYAFFLMMSVIPLLIITAQVLAFFLCPWMCLKSLLERLLFN